MFDHSLVRNAPRARIIGKTASLVLASTLALSSSYAPVLARPGAAVAHSVGPHDYRADFSTRSWDRCVRANGAQIMGNFAGADDWLDSVTGELCRH